LTAAAILLDAAFTLANQAKIVGDSSSIFFVFGEISVFHLDVIQVFVLR
jgi:hypothetical protein